MPPILDYEIPSKKKFHPIILLRIIFCGMTSASLSRHLTPTLSTAYFWPRLSLAFLAGAALGFFLRDKRIPKHFIKPLKWIALILFLIQLANIVGVYLVYKTLMRILDTHDPNQLASFLHKQALYHQCVGYLSCLCFLVMAALSFQDIKPKKTSPIPPSGSES